MSARPLPPMLPTSMTFVVEVDADKGTDLRVLVKVLNFALFQLLVRKFKTMYVNGKRFVRRRINTDMNPKSD